MDIVQLLAPGPFGGLERVVALLSAGLVSRGHAVRALLLVEQEQKEDPALVSTLQHARVTVEVVRAPHRAYVRERALIRRTLQVSRPDIVHTHGYHADVLFRSVAQRLGLPVVTTVHGFTLGGLKNQLFEWLQRRSLRRMDSVVAVSRPLADRLARSGVPTRRLQVIPNAYRAPGSFLRSQEARQQLGLLPDVKVIGWVGRVSPEKGPEVAIEALNLMRSSGAALSIIGRGRMEPALRARVAQLGLDQQVRWHGAIPDAWRLFPAFDVFCLSSHTEGTPMALFEAMAAEVPVVATTVGGVPDVVTEREAFLVPPAAPDRMAAALELALSGVPQRTRAARRRLDQEFGLEAWLDRYEALYGSLVAPEGPRRRIE